MISALCLPLVLALYPAPLAAPKDVPKNDVLRANIDASVNPGVDFFSYANGGWIKRNPIPRSEAEWGIGNLVRDDLYEKLRAINQNAAQKHAKKGSDAQKVGDFWKTAMNQAHADNLGLKPLAPWLAKIDAIQSPKDAINVAFALRPLGVGGFFDWDVEQDEKDSSTMVVGLSQGGLGLPERDFYFNADPSFVKIREEYVKNIQSTLELTNDQEAASESADVMAFETALAKVSRKLEDLRDPIKNYNVMKIGVVQHKLTPSVAWASQLKTWSLKPKTVVVGQPEFFKGMESLVAKTPPATLRAYLRYHLIVGYAPFLDHKTYGVYFNFYQSTLNGQKEPQPRWKRSLSSEGRAIGFILGRLFVKSYFPPTAKKRYSDMVEAFRQSYGRRIRRLSWMSAKTKAKALTKLAALTKKVGYPSKWKDYSKLSIGTTSYAANMIAANKWAFADMLSKYGKPVDRSEWGMTPQTYNAYYNPSNNEIVLPAAQFAIPKMMDSQVDDALAYGYAGASTIGHEMTHGFDDEGRQFDPKGNLKDWWTKADAAKFNKRAQLMVQEFNAYEPLPGLHINGKAGLGENIADYGGLLIGLDAFKQTAAYKSGKKIGGFTPLQRFFLGYAYSWLSEQTTESLRSQLLSDVHSPAKYRVLGPLSNIPDFYKAFGIKPGQPMWRPANKRVAIW